MILWLRTGLVPILLPLVTLGKKHRGPNFATLIPAEYCLTSGTAGEVRYYSLGGREAKPGP